MLISRLLAEKELSDHLLSKGQK